MNDASSVGKITACWAMKTWGGYGVQRSTANTASTGTLAWTHAITGGSGGHVVRSGSTTSSSAKRAGIGGVVTHGICSNMARGVPARPEGGIGVSSRGESVGRADQKANGISSSANGTAYLWNGAPIAARNDPAAGR